MTLLQPNLRPNSARSYNHSVHTVMARGLYRCLKVFKSNKQALKLSIIFSECLWFPRICMALLKAKSQNKNQQLSVLLLYPEAFSTESGPHDHLYANSTAQAKASHSMLNVALRHFHELPKACTPDYSAYKHNQLTSLHWELHIQPNNSRKKKFDFNKLLQVTPPRN